MVLDVDCGCYWLSWELLSRRWEVDPPGIQSGRGYVFIGGEIGGGTRVGEKDFPCH